MPDEILAAEYRDPLTIPAAELGPVTGVVVQRWWPRRREPLERPFHVAVERTDGGYVAF